MTTVTTAAPKYSQELLTATEQTLRSHDLRCRPDIGLDTVLDTLLANGVAPEATNGYLSVSMGGLPAHVHKVFEGLAKQRQELFFPRDPSGVKSRDELDLQGKIAFIKAKGIDAFEKLPQKAATESIVVLDPSRMTKAQFLSLDRKTKAELSAKFGAEQIGKIMARK